jgi:hypothetical protein
MNTPGYLQTKAAAGDREAQFNILLGSTIEGPVTTPHGFAPLALTPSPSRRLFPMLPRSMKGVPAEVVTAFRSLVAGKAPWPLLLHGPAGGGKTCAALALADFAESAAYWTADGLVDAHMGPGKVDVWEAVQGKALVILDEIGAREKVTDLAYSTIKQLVDVREMSCNRVAIYVSNLGPDRLAGLLDDRLASRMLCGTVVEVAGEDRRFTR